MTDEPLKDQDIFIISYFIRLFYTTHACTCIILFIYFSLSLTWSSFLSFHFFPSSDLSHSPLYFPRQPPYITHSLPLNHYRSAFFSIAIMPATLIPSKAKSSMPNSPCWWTKPRAFPCFFLSQRPDQCQRPPRPLATSFTTPTATILLLLLQATPLISVLLQETSFLTVKSQTEAIFSLNLLQTVSWGGWNSYHKSQARPKLSLISISTADAIIQE